MNARKQDKRDKWGWWDCKISQSQNEETVLAWWPFTSPVDKTDATCLVWFDDVPSHSSAAEVCPMTIIMRKVVISNWRNMVPSRDRLLWCNRIVECYGMVGRKWKRNNCCRPSEANKKQRSDENRCGPSSSWSSWSQRSFSLFVSPSSSIQKIVICARSNKARRAIIIFIFIPR